MLRRILTIVAMSVGVIGVGGVLASSGSFDPNGKPPTKGFVAVAAYKWLRDNAPDAIADCEKKVDQYDDLRQDNVSKFKREAINCLASVGFFESYPVSETSTTTTTRPTTTTTRPTTTTTLGPRERLHRDGTWTRFSYSSSRSGGHTGYYTQAVGTHLSGDLNPILFVACHEDGSSALIVGSPWDLVNDDSGLIDVYYEFSSSLHTPDNWNYTTGRWKNVFLSDTFSYYAFIRDRSSVHINTLYILPGDYLHIEFDDGSNYQRAVFDTSNLSDVVDILPCFG